MLVLELYSGVGGMHMALKDSKVEAKVAASVDINTVANTVYKHNFPDTLLLNKNIQSLQASYINSLKVDTILMSPPCQPFTRNGLKGDIKDARTCSFTYLMSILQDLNIKRILMENVKGFESSQMRNVFIETLQKCDYSFQEFILSPNQFGVPNTRYRYYCIAKKAPDTFKFKLDSLMTELPEHYTVNEELYSISEILDENVSSDYLLSDKTLQKRARLMDICYKDSCRSCCFTKAYKRYAEGTGSIYTDKSPEEVNKIFKEVENIGEYTDEQLEKLKNLELRYFTPREVCKLMSFPENFNFPNSISDKQKYMLLGNSINVKVVSCLINILND